MPDEGARSLPALSSFGSGDVFLVGVSEQYEMLIAHTVSPFAVFFRVHERPNASQFLARLRLAASGRALDAVERYRIFHVTNIADCRIAFRAVKVIARFQEEPNQRFARSRYSRNHRHTRASACMKTA